MKRSIKLTEDGSHTLYVEALKEHYHSIHGAFSESIHIFIEGAFKACPKEHVRVLELGFGTGLNALLTCRESIISGRKVYYHGVEKYPLSLEEASLLNYDEHVDLQGISIMDFHTAPGNTEKIISPFFTLYKETSDIRNFSASGLFDVIYFDAFAPDLQPGLWSPDVFRRIAGITAPGGILTTYSVKGIVRRSLHEAGFDIEKIAGPKGKREVLRGVKK